MQGLADKELAQSTKSKPPQKTTLKKQNTNKKAKKQIHKQKTTATCFSSKKVFSWIRQSIYPVLSEFGIHYIFGTINLDSEKILGKSTPWSSVCQGVQGAYHMSFAKFNQIKFFPKIYTPQFCSRPTLLASSFYKVSVFIKLLSEVPDF